MEYKDPSKEMLANGRSMADMMRRGPGGIRGAIISPANTGGTPVNFNPHDKSNVAVQIVDPDGHGSQKLQLSAITKDAMAAATAAADSRVGNAADIETQRERAAVIFEELARQSKSIVKKAVVVNSPPPQEAPVAPNPPPVPAAEYVPQPTYDAAGVPPAPRIDHEYSPMVAFGLSRRSRHPADPAYSRSLDSSPVAAAAPQKLVYFEKEGIGTIHGFFHDVIVRVHDYDDDSPQKGFIVLIYDLRFPQNAARWFPPANDPYGRPWALKVDDDNRLYLVHTTGFQYVYDSREYCVLLIEQALTPPSGEA